MPKSAGSLFYLNFFALWLTLIGSAAAAPDAVSGASLQLTTASATPTSVTFNFSFTHSDGTRKLCYALAPLVPSNNCVTKTPNAKTGQISVTGLQPGSTYSYTFSAIDTRGKHRSSTMQGTFATAKGDVTSLQTAVPRAAASAQAEKRVDILGRSLDHATPSPIRKHDYVHR